MYCVASWSQWIGFSFLVSKTLVLLTDSRCTLNLGTTNEYINASWTIDTYMILQCLEMDTWGAMYRCTSTVRVHDHRDCWYSFTWPTATETRQLSNVYRSIFCWYSFKSFTQCSYADCTSSFVLLKYLVVQSHWTKWAVGGTDWSFRHGRWWWWGGGGGRRRCYGRW